MMKTEPAAQPAATNLTRRSLFALAGAGAAVAAAPAAATGFGRGFTHAVASGEPSARSVLLWTRYVADADTPLTWQVSETESFGKPVAEGSAAASASRDWCAKGLATGLAPGRWYFYRFLAPDGTASPVGRTRTLPEDKTARFRLAVFSCSNYGFGWFNAYGHAVEANDADLAVHLGDYIYEYARGNYPNAGQGVADRVLEPANELVALADYRLRYATYRADPDCQRLHQVLPMISVWDDHESANDSWKDGAENHQPNEGDWQVRKAAAKRAYREWMPVSEEAYATYQVGDLATLFRLDTRLEGREKQFSLNQVMAGKTDPQALTAALTAFRDGEWANKDRQLLGKAQEQWLGEALAASTASGTRWQVLAQQVLMGNLRTPRNVADAAGAGLPDFVRQRLVAAAAASQAGLPSNMDAWDGYPAARERLFEAALDADANLVVLTGDTHNAWAFDLSHAGTPVGVEFGGQSVSSPGFESYLTFVKPDTLAASLVAENSQLKWADTSQRGYMLVELTPASVTTEYRFTGGAKQRSAQLAGVKRITSAKGSRKLAV